METRRSGSDFGSFTTDSSCKRLEETRISKLILDECGEDQENLTPDCLNPGWLGKKGEVHLKPGWANCFLSECPSKLPPRVRLYNYND